MTDKNPSLSTSVVIKAGHGKRSSRKDVLIREEPLEIRLGYTDSRRGRVHKSISITMRTPGKDTALALGFLYSESIIHDYSEILSIDNSRENLIRLELHEDVQLDLQRLERHFYTSSSCGICGKASLEALSLAGAEALPGDDFRISTDTLLGLNAALRQEQQLFRLSGGNHACASFDRQGRILRLEEDVGRHNAMDKLVGGLLQDRQLPMRDSGVLVSGRASFELLQKALMAGCPMFVAVGAPSSLALELAQEFNMSLIGFLSDSSFNIYHGAESVLA